MFTPARTVSPSTGCQVRLKLRSIFGVIRLSNWLRLASVASSSRMYLARFLAMFSRTDPVHSKLAPKAPAAPEERITSCPVPTIGPYIRWEIVLMYRAALSGKSSNWNDTPSVISDAGLTVRHWNRSQIQENRPPAMAYVRAFSVSNTGNRPARSQLSNLCVNRMVMSCAPFQMPAVGFCRNGGFGNGFRPTNAGEKLNTGANRKVFSESVPGLTKLGPMAPAPPEYLASARCSQLTKKFQPFSIR